jgi:hypothetical protein
MFIEITWKNSKGETLKSLVEHTKVQAFVSGFVERDVKPDLTMPEDVVLNQIAEPLYTPESELTPLQN